MSDITITNKKVYGIGGLDVEDMELLSLALHELMGDLEQPRLDRGSKLVQAVDSQLQPK